MNTKKIEEELEKLNENLKSLGLGNAATNMGAIEHLASVIADQPKKNTASLELVCRTVLLEILFPHEQSRPSIRWLSEMQAKNLLPYRKIGRMLFFDPAEVRAAIDAQFTVHASHPKKRTDEAPPEICNEFDEWINKQVNACIQDNSTKPENHWMQYIGIGYKTLERIRKYGVVENN